MKDYSFLDPENPFISEGMKRRAAADLAPVDRTQELVDPYEGNWGAEATRSIATRTANDFTNGIEYLGRGLIGDTEGRQRAAEEYMLEDERARAMGPDIQSFEDASAAGGGIGNYGAALGFMAAGMAPDVVSAGTGIGLGGAIARRAARTGIERKLVREIGADTREQVARANARDQAARAARETAEAGGARPDAVANAMRVARVQVDEAAQQSARQVAVQIAGRTPAQHVIEQAAKRGGRIGGTLGAVPTLSGQTNAEKAADAETSTSDMWALAAGTTAAAATQVVPLERFFGRFGAAAQKEVAERAQRFLPRATREALTQGAYEGGQEVLQQALQNASHAYVEENLDTLVGPDAFKQYLVSFMAGGILGGAMGAAGEVGRAGGNLAARGLRKGGEAWKALRGQLATGAQAARERFRERTGAATLAEDATPAQRFAAAQDDLQHDEGVDEMTESYARDINDLFNRAVRGDQAPLTEPQRRAQNNPLLQKMTPLQRVLASHLGEAIMLPAGVETVRPWIESAEKLFTNSKLDDLDRSNIDKLRELIPKDVALWEATGPNYADLTEHARKASKAAEQAAAEEKAEAEARAKAERGEWAADGKKDDVEEQERAALEEAGALVDLDTRDAAARDAMNPDAVADVESSFGDGLDESEQSGYGGMQEGGRDILGGKDDPIQQLVNTARDAPDHDKVRDKARHYLLGGTLEAEAVDEFIGEKPAMNYAGGNAGRIIKENGKFPKEYARMAAEPGYIEMEGFSLNNGTPLRRAVDLAKVIQLVQGKTNLEGDALIYETFGQLKLLELGLKPSTLKPGPLYRRDDKGNKIGEPIATLTDDHIAFLRAKPGSPKYVPPGTDLGKSIADRKVMSPEEEAEARARLAGARTLPTPATTGAISGVRAARARGDEKPGRLPGWQVESVVGEDDRGQVDDETRTYELGPRTRHHSSKPNVPLMRDADGQRNATAGQIYDVSVSLPYIQQMRAVRRAAKKSPAAERAAAVKAGVEIGTAEIQKRVDAGTLNLKAATRATRALAQKDAVALAYFRRAVAGEFDPDPRVHETALQGAKELDVARPPVADAVEDIKKKLDSVLATARRMLKSVEGARAKELTKRFFANGKSLPENLKDESTDLWRFFSPKSKFMNAEAVADAIEWLAHVADLPAKTALSKIKDGAAPTRDPSPPVDPASVNQALAPRQRDILRKAMWELRQLADDLPADHPIAEALSELPPRETTHITVATEATKKASAKAAQGKTAQAVSLQKRSEQRKAERDRRQLSERKRSKGERVRAANKDTDPGNTSSVGIKPEDKAALAAEISADIEAYLAKGGEIETLKDEGDLSDEAEDTSHDVSQDQALVDAMAKALGLKHPLRVVSLSANSKDHGSYSRKQRVIRMNPKLSGKARVEVLMHELGHHIVFEQIDKHINDWTVTSRMTLQQALEALADVEPELHSALLKDFEAYKAKIGKIGTTKRTALMARKPIARAQMELDSHRRGQDGEVPESFFDAEGFHEWIADHIARALTTDKKPVGIVEKFFKSIAEQLKTAWDVLTNNGKASFKPAPSVEAWIQQLFNAEAAAVELVSGAPAPRAGVEGTIAAGAEMALTNGAFKVSEDNIEAFKQMIRTVLRPQERQILERALTRGATQLVMRKAVIAMAEDNHALRDYQLKLLDDAAEGAENRIVIGYMLWASGRLNVGPKSVSALHGMTDDLLAMVNLAGTGEYAHQIFSDIADGTINRIHAAGREYDIKKIQATKRGGLQAALNRAIATYDKAVEPLSKAFSSQLQRMRSAGIPTMARIAGMIYRPNDTTGEDNGMTPAITDVTASYLRRATKAMDGLTDRQRLKVIRNMQRKRKPDGKVPAVDKAMAEMQTLFAAAHKYMADAGLPVGKIEDFFPIVFDTQHPRGSKILQDLYLTKEADGSYRYEKPIREFFEAVAESRAKDAKGKGKPAKAAGVQTELPPADPAALEYFEKKREKMRPGVASTNDSIVDAITHGTIADIKVQIDMSYKREEKRETVDAELANAFRIERRYMSARIKQLQDAGLGEHDGPAAKGAPAGDAKGVAPDSFETMVENLVKGAMSDSDMMPTPGTLPNFRGEKHRLSEFIYKHGDPGDIKKFASVQSTDPAEIFSGYFEPMVKRVEFHKYFGGGESGRQKLDDLLEKMKAEGATKAQIEEAENAVMAAIGAYGKDGSPVLAAISPALAQRFSGPKTKGAVQGLQAYQNLRLLPLSLLSSLVDPMGVAMRTGGDFKTAWEGIRVGLGTIFNGESREEMRAALEMLGASDDVVPAVGTAGAGFDKPSPFAKKVNDFVFRANMMHSWVEATRFMALRAGHAFLIKHKAGAAAGDDTSLRYLAELGLTHEQINIVAKPTGVGKTTRMEVEITDATRAALGRFVNEAVLRPHSQQVPQWYNDPYMGLVTQYKTFLYAIYDQIGGRMFRELEMGNPKVLLAAMSYLPIVIMAELLRELIQYGMEGNPKRAEWDAGDYTWLGVERSGLLGPKVTLAMDAIGDVENSRVPGTSFAGPTFGQALNVRKVLEGQRNAGGEFESALPFNPIYKHWFNPTEAQLDASSTINPSEVLTR